MRIAYRRSAVQLAAFAALVAPLVATRADAACSPGTICPGAGTTCTISTLVTVDNGCLLTWSNKNVTVAAGGTIQVASGGSFTIEAGSLVVNGLLSAPAGAITIRAIESLPTFNGQFRTTGAGRVEANGGSPVTTVGAITVTGKSVQMDGTSSIQANGTGGSVDICGGTRTGGGGCIPGGTVSLTSIPALSAPAIVVGGNGDLQIAIEGTTITIGTNVNGANTLLRASAREADLDGGTIFVHATNSATIYGDMEANAFATQNDDGSGGAIDVEVAPGAGTIQLGSKAVLQATGGDGEDSVDGAVALTACSLTFAGTLDTNGPTHSGDNTITYRGTLNASGGTGTAGAEGANTVICRQNAGGTACQSPLTGHPSWNPNVDIVPVPFGPCTGCGNGIVEGTEQCDDGNTLTCDSCSPTCVSTNPHAACNDGNPCTSPDACDGVGHCTGMRDCDDGNPCTADSCSPPTGCVHTANNCTYVAAATFTGTAAQVGTPDGQPLAATTTRIAVRDGSSQVSVVDASTGAFQYALSDPDAMEFAHAIAMAGSNLLVGVPGSLSDRGEVRVFAASNGAPLGTIDNPSNTMWGSQFGWSVAANGPDEAITGVLLDDTTGIITKGAAYRTDLAGTLINGFFAPVGSPVQAVGWSVAALNGTVAVSGIYGDGPTYNEVLIFPETGGSNPLRIISNQGANDQFGESVSLMSTSSATVGNAQGTPVVLVSDDDGTQRAFAYDTSTGTLVHTFQPANGSEVFGYPVAGVAGNALVGIQGSPVGVRLFRGTDWTQLATLTPPAGSAFAVVAVRGADILVGGNTGVVVYKTKCGNGVVDAGEACDDGNTRDDDCCTSNCTVAPFASLCNVGGSPCMPGQCLGATCITATCLSGAPCGGGGVCGPPGSCTCQ